MDYPKNFLPLFIDKYIQIINMSLENGILIESQRGSIITLLCKDPSNKEFLKNWRPISLLNVDYKIISKVLTNRLSKCLQYIIHENQTCAVPGRTISDNVHLLRNIIDYVNDKHFHCALISLDQSKAFDRVSHFFMFKVLRAFGFGNYFISLIKLLYTSCYARVQVNGFISETFFNNSINKARLWFVTASLYYVL